MASDFPEDKFSYPKPQAESRTFVCESWLHASASMYLYFTDTLAAGIGSPRKTWPTADDSLKGRQYQEPGGRWPFVKKCGQVAGARGDPRPRATKA